MMFNEATTVLKDNDFLNKLTSVVVAEIPDIPGGLSQILKVFADENINLAYMYALSAEGSTNKAYMVFKVDDHKTAQAALTRAGIRVVSQEEISTL